MHVRVRIFGKPDTVVVVESKLTKIEKLRSIIQDKFDVETKSQRLFYGGKLLEDGYTFHDYNIKLNDVIQVMVKIQSTDIAEQSAQVRNDRKPISDKIRYSDAESEFYAVGDFIDFRENDQGSWVEGKIVRICHDPVLEGVHKLSPNSIENKNDYKTTHNQLNDNENKPPTNINNCSKTNCKSIAKYFTKTPKKSKTFQKEINASEDIVFKIQLDADSEDSDTYCKIKDIRPRARSIISIDDLKISQMVMVNHNPDEPLEKGYWFDFKVAEIKKLKRTYELLGTMYIGQDVIPQHDMRIKVIDNIYAIEEVVPINKRTVEYNKKMEVIPDKRSMPLNCLVCRDVEETPCKDCGCFVCLGKESPDKIVLCDECDNGYHMTCLDPPLLELPEEDWYCPSCKRDGKDVVAPGAAKQTKKTSKTNRDWGRGMACVGKTKTCTMPANHFGPIPGIEVGMCWRFRIQLSESGVHRPPVSGIHGRDVEGAYSIVLSGGYEDDVDNGNEFTYTGSGGRDLSGNKRTAEQSCDQTLTRENKALARNCAVKCISESGGDAGKGWREGRPVRVVRSYKMLKHFPKYAPKEGIRYDGIYKVVKFYPEKGLSGYQVWKYLLRRDDPHPAPWEAGAKQYPTVYPDGYLEAEAEKKALKEKCLKNVKSNKRKLQDKDTTGSESKVSPYPVKRRKISPKNELPVKDASISSNKIPIVVIEKLGSSKKVAEMSLSDEEKAAVESDTLNSKIWTECLNVCESKGKVAFVEYVSQTFLCIICQEVAVTPVTTPCLHNFCMGCIKLAFKSSPKTCPCCRQDLDKFELKNNEQLTKALRSILTGYDAGKK